MKPTIHTLLFFALAFLFWTCEGNKEPAFSISEKLKGEKLEEFEKAVSSKIGEYVNTSNDSSHVSLGESKVFISRDLIELYQAAENQRLWVDDKNRKDLVEILEASYFEGLNPEDYHFAQIKQLLNDKKDNLDEEAVRLADLDVLMSDAILLFAFHMIQGKVDPVALDPMWNYSKVDIPDDIEFLLMARLEEQSLLDSAVALRPQMPMYHQLRKWLIHYDSIKDKDIEISQLKFPGESLELGDSSDIVAEIKNHLRNFDLSGTLTRDGYFDETLKNALIEFQEHFGLATDGVAGESTFEALNTSIEDRMNMIRINMERCRWIGNVPPQEFLLVNIADFQLYIFQEGEIEYSSRVVVGKEYNKTPVFTSDIQYVVFNPTWTIPYSIASKETLPRLKTDPNYLQNRNMTLLRNGREIDPRTVNFSNYSQSNFPFTIRQEPGAYNALGRVKFIFPNKYSVYLHDTPSKSYFNRTQRTFSHGCVRVENPLLLAEELLGDKGYDQKKIGEVLKTNQETVVHLKDKMKVMLMYWTCYDDLESGKLYFYKDVYGRDGVILEELRKTRML